MEKEYIGREEALEFVVPVMVARFADKSEVEYLSFYDIVEETQTESLVKKLSKDLVNVQLEKIPSSIIQLFLDKLREEYDDSIVLDNHEAIINTSSGFRCVILRKNEQSEEIFVGFGGTGSGHKKRMYIKQGFANVKQFAGLRPRLYYESFSIVRIIKDHFSKSKIIVCGHSLGGALAQYATLKNKIIDDESMRAYCFSSAALAKGIQKEIADDILLKADQFIKHLTVEGDFVNDPPKPFKNIGSFASNFITVPHNFGRKLFLSSMAGDNFLEKHIFFHYTFFQFLDEHF